MTEETIAPTVCTCGNCEPGCTCGECPCQDCSCPTCSHRDAGVDAAR